MRAVEMQETSLAQGQRRVREELRALQNSPGEVLQASPGRFGRQRGLPQMPIASGSRATSFASGAVTDGTSSAGRASRACGGNS